MPQPLPLAAGLAVTGYRPAKVARRGKSATAKGTTLFYSTFEALRGTAVTREEVSFTATGAETCARTALTDDSGTTTTVMTS